jgi:hypothetical protein
MANSPKVEIDPMREFRELHESLDPMREHRKLQEQLDPMREFRELHESLDPMREHRKLQEQLDPMREFRELHESLDPMREHRKLQEQLDPMREFRELHESLDPMREHRKLQKQLDPMREFRELHESLNPMREYRKLQEQLNPMREFRELHESLHSPGVIAASPGRPATVEVVGGLIEKAPPLTIIKRSRPIRVRCTICKGPAQIARSTDGVLEVFTPCECGAIARAVTRDIADAASERRRPVLTPLSGGRSWSEGSGTPIGQLTLARPDRDEAADE